MGVNSLQIAAHGSSYTDVEKIVHIRAFVKAGLHFFVHLTIFVVYYSPSIGSGGIEFSEKHPPILP